MEEDIPPSSFSRTRDNRCYNSAVVGFRGSVGEIKDAHERAVERGMNLAAPFAGREGDLTDKRTDIA